MMAIDIRRLLYLCVFCVCLLSVNGKPTNDSSEVADEDMSGNMLIKLGQKISNPFLKLVGMVIRGYHPCSEWTEWSECSELRMNYFGTQTRSRKCKEMKESGDSEDHHKGKVETEVCSNLCEGFCPKDYTTTNNRMCIKFYEKATNKESAGKACTEDGGRLVQIDNDLKARDVSGYLNGLGYAHVWIDGQRENTSEPWKYATGDKIRYFNWASGQPDNYTDNTCLSLSSINGRMYATVCSAGFPFLCELVD